MLDRWGCLALGARGEPQCRGKTEANVRKPLFAARHNRNTTMQGPLAPVRCVYQGSMIGTHRMASTGLSARRGPQPRCLCNVQGSQQRRKASRGHLRSASLRLRRRRGSCTMRRHRGCEPLLAENEDRADPMGAYHRSLVFIRPQPRGPEIRRTGAARDQHKGHRQRSADHGCHLR